MNQPELADSPGTKRKRNLQAHWAPPKPGASLVGSFSVGSFKFVCPLMGAAKSQKRSIADLEARLWCQSSELLFSRTTKRAQTSSASESIQDRSSTRPAVEHRRPGWFSSQSPSSEFFLLLLLLLLLLLSVWLVLCRVVLCWIALRCVGAF